ncbi:hypothetical protein D3C72_1480030 [compost metagenome]
MAEESLPVGIGDVEPFAYLVELFRNVFSVFAPRQQEDLGWLSTAPLHGEFLTTNPEAALELVLNQLRHAKQRVLVAVGAVEKMDDLNQAGLSGAISGLLFSGLRTLVGKQNIETLPEGDSLERTERAFNGKDHCNTSRRTTPLLKSTAVTA